MPRLPAGRPWISANFVMTWDGRISTRNRTPSDFSSAFDKRRLLEIRSAADAVLASAVTVAADRMTMGLPDATLRSAREARGQQAYPLRVLVSNSGRIDPKLPLFTSEISPVVVFSTEQMPLRTRAALASHAALRLTAAERVDMKSMAAILRREYSVQRLHCEGGGSVFRSLLAADLVDELYLTLAPRIFGSQTAPTLTGPPVDFFPRSIRAKLVEMETVGEECFLRYRVIHGT